jgi:hypothetical protein
MTFQPGANLYTQGFGSRPENVEVPHLDVRAPAATDILYPIGKRWIFVGDSEYVLISQSTSNGVTTSNWVQGASRTGNIVSVTGTANQITDSTTAGAVTLSTPATFVAPGSIAATTTLTATLGDITATNGNLTLGTAGNKINITTGTNGSAGTSGAMTAGSVVVNTTAITANSLVFFATHTLGTVTVPQAYRVSARTPGTSFTIQSQSATDTSTVDYWIIN